MKERLSNVRILSVQQIIQQNFDVYNREEKRKILTYILKTKKQKKPYSYENEQHKVRLFV
jgi:hypothetical protein